MSNPAKPWRHVVLLLSLFVFLLALHAKLSAYPQSAPANQNSSSKLWLSGQKMETRASIKSSDNVLPGIFALFLFFAVALVQRPLQIDPPLAPVPSSAALFPACRFFRPPPTL